MKAETQFSELCIKNTQ